MNDDQRKQLVERLEALGAKEDGRYFPDREKPVPVPLSLLDDIVDALTEQPARRGRPRGEQELSIHAERIARILRLGMGHCKNELLKALVKEQGLDKAATRKLRIMVNAHLRRWHKAIFEAITNKKNGGDLV
ncbi:hypothetical protein E0H56_27810 [Rhizobium leguminosarum bv. viciae]|uniref:hypothetical protein n=1 Tax=Rhizobium leguminosarum TaxID=384 RepID=UPI00103AD204|nr:hypothetical protein [Rhizobium leguminosarum]TBZ86159.1 hypothetical protein E0H56_27810 [Rhizobium leguminosarum bv. viciae]